MATAQNVKPVNNGVNVEALFGAQAALKDAPEKGLPTNTYFGERYRLHRFMNGQCGLVNRDNPCRCPKKTRGFIEHGHVDPQQLLFVAEHVERVREVAGEAVREIEDIVARQHAEIFRDHPFLQPADQTEWLRRMLEKPAVQEALHLN